VSWMAKGKYEYWLTSEGLLKLEGWARDGLTEEQIAKNMGISRSTLNEWKKKYPDILNTLKKGKEVADRSVENALYESAIGKKYKVKKPIKVKEVQYKDGKRVKEVEHIEYAEEEIVIPPNTTAQIFWLKNRKPDVWRDKQDVHVKDDTDKKKKVDNIASILEQMKPVKEGD
jgi:transcriptional regulator with XRE-family HTH domain